MNGDEAFVVGYRGEMAHAHSRSVARRLSVEILLQLATALLAVLIMSFLAPQSAATASGGPPWRLRHPRGHEHAVVGRFHGAAGTSGPEPPLLCRAGILTPYPWEQVVLHPRRVGAREVDVVDLWLGPVRLELLAEALTEPVERVMADRAHFRGSTTTPADAPCEFARANSDALRTSGGTGQPGASVRRRREWHRGTRSRWTIREDTMSRITRQSLAVTLGLALVGAAGVGVASADDSATPYTRTVSRADVDGDGRADTTTLTADRDSTSGPAVLTVRTATGRTMSTTTEMSHTDLDRSFWGAAKVDGEAGYELVLWTDMGAHTGWFRVITERGGRLTTLVDPSGAYRWSVDQAVWVGKGYRRTTTSTGRAKMTMYTATATTGGSTFDQTVRSYQWSNGRWARMGAVERKVKAAEAYRYADWYVPYLPKFYG